MVAQNDSRRPNTIVLLILITLLCGLIGPQFGAAALPGPITYFSVTFTKSATAYEPFGKGGGISVRAADKGVQRIEALRKAITFEPVYRRGTIGYTVQGPWLIGLYNIDDADAILRQLKADPRIASVSAAPMDLQPVLGDHGASFFPEDKPRLCDAQRQLHGRLASEEPFRMIAIRSFT